MENQLVDSVDSDKNFASVAFNILDKNALTEIFIRMKPADVLNLCQINQQFNYVCEDRSVFIKLLDHQFPNSYYSDDPKKQYIALASGIVHFYTLEVLQTPYQIDDADDNENIELLALYDNVLKPFVPTTTRRKLDYTNKIRVGIAGLPPKSGTKFLIVNEESTEKSGIHVFKTMDSAVNWFMEIKYDDFLYYVIILYQEEYDPRLIDPVLVAYKTKLSDTERDRLTQIIFKYSTFDQFLADFGYPRFMDRDYIRDFIYRNGYISFEPRADRAMYLYTFTSVHVQ